MGLNLEIKRAFWQRNARRVLVAVLAFGGAAQSVRAQEAEEQKAGSAKATPAADPYVTIYLNNVGQPQEANDLQTAVRNMVGGGTRVYYEQTANAITLRGKADDLALAQKVIADLDRPKKTYRLEYTVEMMDGTKHGAAQHYALIAIPGQRAQMKLGNRVPLVMGKMDGDGGTPPQVQYMDVGLSISAMLSGSGDGLTLQTKVEQTALAEEKSGMGPQDPVLHQAVLENAAAVTVGKAMRLGSLDVPGGTERLEVEVVAEVVK